MRSAVLVLSVFLGSNAFAKGDIRPGSKVDLTCTEGEGRHNNKISLTVREKGPVARKAIPKVVPAVFMDDLQDEKFQLREFEIKGHVTLAPNENAKVIYDMELNTSFYGGLSYPDIGEGFEKTNAYGSYEERAPFRALTISQDNPNEEPEFDLYYQAPGFASNASLKCKGTLVSADVARPGVVKEERFDRVLTCSVGEAKDFKAAIFEMRLTNLQNTRLLSFEGNLMQGKDMKKHVLGKLNDADAQVLRQVNDSKATPKTRLVSKYFDECGEFNCFSIELDLAYPKRTDKKISGVLRYRENKEVRDEWKPYVKSRAEVNCTVK